MQKITSAQNPLIKKVKKLGTSRKFRDEEGLIVLDGVHLVEEYFANVKMIQSADVLVTESFLKSNEYDKFKSLENQTVVPDDLLEKIAPTKTPGGILVIATTPSFKASQLQNSKLQTALILDHLQDPGNVGTILRTAVAGGVDAVYLYQCADIWSPKCLRAGQGAQFYDAVNFIEVESTSEIRTSFGGMVYGMSLEKDSQNFYETKFPGSHAFALGNEGQGLTSQVQEICDKFCYIPMQNNFESLNVGVTAGICLFRR